MPEGIVDSANSDATPSVTGEATEGNAAFLGSAEEAELESLDDLLSNRGRYRLREMADVMKDSGALRIKDHRTLQGNNPDTFKGEYAKDWILRNEKLVNLPADAVKVSQAMLDLNIFHSVTNNTIFDCKNLYAFREPGSVGGLGMLKNRIVAIEDYNIAQTKANKEAQAEAAAKTVQLDWRVSVTERRLEAAEGTLRRALVVQQVVLATLLIVLVLVYAPIWANVAVFMMSLVAVLLVVILLESRSILRDTLHLKVDYTKIANGIMGIVPDDEEDGLSSGRLEAPDAQDEAWSSLLSFRGHLSDAVSALSDGWEQVSGMLRFRSGKAHGPALGNWTAGTNGNHSEHATRARQPPPKPRVSGAGLSGATRLIGQASGRLTKILCQDDRCKGLRRQSAPVHWSAELDAPVWAGVERPATTEGNTLLQQPSLRVNPHTAMPGPPTLRDFDDWWNGDMVVRQPAGEVRLVRPMSTRGRVRVNYADSHAFDGPLFAGKISVWVKGLPLGEDCPDVFRKVRRRTWVIVQGRFKERISVSRVHTGQAFKQPLEVVPKHIMRAAMLLLQSFTRMVSSASIIQNRGAPIVMYPLVLGAQVVHVAMPGSEPNIDDLDITDDVRLLVPQLTSASGDAPASESERRSYFSKDSKRQDTFFDPQHVYTFHVRQHVVDVANYRFPTSLGSINLLSYLKGQPLRFMAVDVESQQHLWNLEAWHRQLLDGEHKQDTVDTSSTHAASVSTDSIAEVRSNGYASPTVLQPPLRNDASFVSDSPLALSGAHSDDPFEDRSTDALAVHGPVEPDCFNSCSFGNDTVVGRRSSVDPTYSAVNITVPTDLERANSSTTPTPKPFLDPVYAVPPPASEGQQLRARLLATHGQTVPALFNERATDMLFSAAPPTGGVSSAHAMELNAVASEAVSEHAPSGEFADASPVYPRSLPNAFARAPSSRASFNGQRTDASQESNVTTPAAKSDAGPSRSDKPPQKLKKGSRLKNPFRRTPKKDMLK